MVSSMRLTFWSKMKILQQFCVVLFFTTGLLADSEKSSTPVEGKEKSYVSLPYESPSIRDESVHFAEHFDNYNDFKRRWIPSASKKPGVSDDIAQYDGKWDLLPLERFPLDGDKGLVLASESRHAAISAKLRKPFHFDGSKTFIIQYVVTFQKKHDCGGAYIKLLTEGSVNDLTQFNDQTPYTIMFGPDKCGGVAKVHFIIRHKNPINGTIVEKHCTSLKSDEAIYNDNEPTLFKLVIKPDNTFAFYLNNKVQYEGNLLDEDVFSPPIVPPKEIIDETDSKPEDWDDRPKIPDPDAIKPDDWDENEPMEIPDPDAVMPDDWLEDEPVTIPDTDAVKPVDWDDEMDGIWEPPYIENPRCKDADGCGPWTPPNIENVNYKGKWKPPLLDNPNYKGKWNPRKIANPDYYRDENPLKSSPIGAVGFELWSLVNKIYFDDILITSSEEVSDEWTEKTWATKKKNIAKESATFYKLASDYMSKYPWLWAVFMLILAVIVAFIGMFFFRSKKEKEESDRTALLKKEDISSPDDEEIPHYDENEELNDGQTDEVEREEELAENYADNLDEVDESDLTEEDDDEDEKEPENDEEVASEPHTPPRKRRTRKD